MLKTIFSQKAISRAEIARMTKLSSATVFDMGNDLICEGLVAEVGHGFSICGKSPILISLVPDSCYMLGLQLEQNKCVGVIKNLQEEIKETVEVAVLDNNGEQVLKSVL